MPETVKKPPAMQETEVQSLGREDSLEKGMATHSSNSCLDNPMDTGAWRYTPWGRNESDTAERLSLTFQHKGGALTV